MTTVSITVLSLAIVCNSVAIVILARRIRELATRDHDH